MTSTRLEQAAPRLAAGSPAPAISLTGLTKSFGPVRAVRGIDLQVEQGEIVAFLGPNGAGRTTAIELADAVRRVHAGLRVVDPELATHSLVSGDSPLTARETDVLRAAREGAAVATIARVLVLSEGTVRNHLSSAIGKTGTANRAEAARVAELNGWL